MGKNEWAESAARVVLTHYPSSIPYSIPGMIDTAHLFDNFDSAFSFAAPSAVGLVCRSEDADAGVHEEEPRSTFVLYSLRTNQVMKMLSFRQLLFLMSYSL
jgi:hypothetical protein